MCATRRGYGNAVHGDIVAPWGAAKSVAKAVLEFELKPALGNTESVRGSLAVLAAVVINKPFLDDFIAVALVP